MLFSKNIFGKQVSGSEVTDDGIQPDQRSEISDGSIKYVAGQGGNSAEATYQEASGAPVESSSPMGYSVNSFTILFLNISMMIGTGIFSTRELHYWLKPALLTKA